MRLPRVERASMTAQNSRRAPPRSPGSAGTTRRGPETADAEASHYARPRWRKATARSGFRVDRLSRVSAKIQTCAIRSGLRCVVSSRPTPAFSVG